MAVTISAWSDPFYGSLYLQGLQEVFGRREIRVSSHGFPEFAARHALAFWTTDSRRHIYIDTRDDAGIDPIGLEWSDVYAKVNLSCETMTGTEGHKLLPIGPHFPLRAWRLFDTARMCLSSLWQSRYSLHGSFREHVANYWRQYRRPPLSAFQYRSTSGDYVFFASALWKREPVANELRANFIRACRRLSRLKTEVGFTPRSKKDMDGYADLTLSRRYSAREYVTKLSQSSIAFSTPAVAQCHGWKLGEYLALGKAIISTPLSRELPAPLIHGEHVHIVDGTTSALEEAIGRLTRDHMYRHHLERSARHYFETYLAPEPCIRRIMVGVMRRTSVPGSTQPVESVSLR